MCLFTFLSPSIIQLISTTKLIQTKITKPICDFTCHWGATLKDLFSCPPNIILDLFRLLAILYSCNLSIYLFINPFRYHYPSIYPFICLSIFIHSSSYPSIYLSINLNSYPSICLTKYLSKSIAPL